MTKGEEDFLKASAVFLGFGVLIWLLDDDVKKPQRRNLEKNVSLGKNLNSGRRNSPRENFEFPVPLKVVPVVPIKETSVPNRDFTKDSKILSRCNTSSSVKDFTSKKTFNSITPSNILSTIRKYPSEYYLLSKKQQWKFRKRSSCPTVNN